jgi:choline dehydrogenase
VVHDSPNLGENLHDHPNAVVLCRGKGDVDCDWPQLYGFDRMNPALPLPKGQSDTCFVFFPARSSMREGATRLSATKRPQWLYKIRLVRGLVRALTYFVFGLPFAQRLPRKTWGLVVILGKPLSRGRVRLASTDPREQAELDPTYYRNPADLETMALGVEKAFTMVNSASMARWGNQPLMRFPSATTPRDQLKQWIAKTAMTTFHFAGTCRMGDDAAAPVTTDLRLRGVTGVRVADASVIPFTPVSAMNAPSMLVGYRAAQLIRAAFRRNSATEHSTAPAGSSAQRPLSTQ